MEFDLDDQQRELRDTARRFLEKEAPVAHARAMIEDPTGHDLGLWKRMGDLGWMGLAFDEADGGAGIGFIGQAIVLAEMGRVVLPGPYFSSVVLGGTTVLEAGGDEQRARLLPAIAAGEVTATLAHHGHVDERGGKLHGERRLVTDGAIAERVLVIAHLDGGDEPGFFLAEPTTRTPVETIDATRKVADLTFDGVEGERLARGGAAVMRRIADRAAVGLAAEMLGIAERVLELSVEYAKQREQFGRPIGSFQAVKHRLADMLVDVESLRSAVYYAAWAIERDHPDATLAASMAKAYASDACPRVAAGGIQVHGGIGFTWEHDMHLYFKRAKADAATFGDATHHRERMARILHERYAEA